MKYTNGFDIDLVLPALQQRLGWQQPTVSGSPVLSADNLLSKSGRYFNDGSFHSICTVANIYSAQEDAEISDNDFNTFLTTFQKSSILRSLNEVFRQPELLEQKLLYTRYGANDLALPNTGAWSGWCIEVATEQGIATKVNFGTFYFDADCTVTLYLFQDGIREPLKTWDIDVVAYQHTIYEFDDLVLQFKTGARYFLLYDTSSLEGQNAHAIREQVETFAKTNCFKAYSYSAERANDGTYFNHNNRQYPAFPLGINLEVITFRDHTQKILRKANLFDEVQGLQMAAMAMELVNNSTRTNAEQRQSQQQSQQTFIELNQAFATKEAPITPGIKPRIIGELRRLKDTFFPPAAPFASTLLKGGDFDLDSYERTWARQVYTAHTNPGVLVE